jgi:hypothetical protein
VIPAEGVGHAFINLKNTNIIMGKNKKKVTHTKREEEKANKVVSWVFGAFIVLAVIIIIGYAVNG